MKPKYLFAAPIADTNDVQLTMVDDSGNVHAGKIGVNKFWNLIQENGVRLKQVLTAAGTAGPTAIRRTA